MKRVRISRNISSSFLTLLKIALLSGPVQGLYYLCGRNEPIIIHNDSASDKIIFKIKLDNSDFEIIPEIRNQGFGLQLFPHQQINRPEFTLYYVKTSLLQKLHLTMTDRKESDLSCYNSSEIEHTLQQTHLRQFYSFLKMVKSR